jgi:hypothetical protein
VVPSDQAVRACATATACGLESDFDDCIRTFADLTASIARTGTAIFGPADVACLARAGSDCDAAQRCTNAGAAPESCTGGSAQCDGEVVRGCLFGFTRAFDCASVGLHCIASTSGGASCGAASCATNGTQCDVSGAAVLDCSDGVEQRHDCTIDDSACSFSGQVAICAGTGPSCMMTTTCDGDVIVGCDTGRLLRHDCAARGLHCIVNYHPNADFECGNGTDCDPATAKASCDGSGRMHYCYLGTPLVADCKASGFSGCSANGCVR